MGTWGVNSFDNDVAMDWAAEASLGGRDALSAALEAALEADELDADLMAQALAAAEVVASALGRPHDAEAARIAGNLGASPSEAQALAEAAGHVIMRATGPASELRQLWEDAGPEEFGAWIASLTSLRARLSGEEAGSAQPAAAVEVDLAEALVLEVRALKADIAVLRQELADGLRQIRRDILGGRA